MSKKKATMTLKDFHGGSIPSDLPLPSAPGVIMRHLDRAGFDRQTSWVNPMGRSDHRLRPNSAGAGRPFGDNPFLTHSAHIGRNFDEDERKPIDGVSGPRRTVSDDSLRALPSGVEPRSDSSATGRVPGRPVTTPVSQFSCGNTSSYAARVSEATHGGVNAQTFSGNAVYVGSEVSHVGVNYPNVGGNSGQTIAGSYSYAWGLRKEVEPAWSAPDSASKLAHASALDKVSSGRWHTKQPLHSHADAEIIKPSETEREANVKGNNMCNMNTYNVMDGRDYQDVTLARLAERSLTFEDGTQGGGKEVATYERVISPIYSEAKERNPPIYADGVQQPRSVVKFDGPDLQSPVPSETSERPKLKLLPRSKPLENMEPFVDHKLEYQQPVDPVFVENESGSSGNTNIIKPGLGGFESGNQDAERPKLSLKPRSQPIEQMDRNVVTGRKTLFGGARPRELVLKERRIDDESVNDHELGQPSNRVRKDIPRNETVPIQMATRHNEIPENTSLDHRIGKNPDRRDHRVDGERVDVPRNWRSENRRNGREIENQQHQHQHQHPQERPPSPETWRKPVEQPKSASLDSPRLRYGKAASAVELAQAFSRSISDPKIGDRISGQRGPPAGEQLPFSRLLGPTTRPHINGY
ncbi:unnamed protein product [Ilex paraguariensis]|uniref:Eukaryotic translation initiation factor-related n=1 Tax=Ilex paraguariensis TaxID=185542 RepID=A0ABC8T2F2_9AQUA